jgi:outer membrane protein
LFAGGLYLARQHEAELRAQADDELLRALGDNIVRDVHIAWLNVNTALEQLRTTEQLASNAAEAYDLAAARYKIGSSSIVELSQAQLSLTSAQIANTNARYNVLIQQANLNYQTGVLR